VWHGTGKGERREEGAGARAHLVQAQVIHRVAEEPEEEGTRGLHAGRQAVGGCTHVRKAVQGRSAALLQWEEGLLEEVEAFGRWRSCGGVSGTK